MEMSFSLERDSLSVIQAREVSKLHLPIAPMRRMFGKQSIEKMRKQPGAVCAVDSVSFSVKRGESVAIIGRNGSGKSTLLEMIAGTTQPTHGSVHVRGRVAALLELGSGFDPALSGRENAMMNGLLLGATRREVENCMAEIARFAELEDVLDRPVSTYSSGMVVRLAFSTQIAFKPDVLIVDEALSVGDFFFQQKCAAYIKGLRSAGVTLLFVSHDMALVRDLCTRAILMDRGVAKFDGDVLEASRLYFALGQHTAKVNDDAVNKSPLGKQYRCENDEIPNTSLRQGSQSSGITRNAIDAASIWREDFATSASNPATLYAVCIVNSLGEASSTFRIGEVMIVRVAYKNNTAKPMHVSIELTNRVGQLITCIGSYSARSKIDEQTKRTWCICDVEMTLNVEAGEYSLKALLAEENGMINQGVVLASTPSLGPIQVRWNYEQEIAPHLGLVGLPHRVAFREIADAAA
jgi:lipopolysaccharide transport system ATP-binding protein